MRILLLALLFLSLGLSPRSDLFQVVTSHPAEIEELNPYVETVHKEGRLWIVELKENVPEELFHHLRPLNGDEKSYIFKGLVLTKASKMSKDTIRERLSLVNQTLIMNDIKNLSSYQTRYTGTKENQKALSELKVRLTGLGYKLTEDCFGPGKCNLIAEKKGFEKPQDVMIVVAHIDSVGEENAGADDNASGVAALLEMARVLKDYKNKSTLRFLITNGEEQNLLGSKHYVETLKNSKDTVTLALTMDMIGYNDNNLVELETNVEYEDLAIHFAQSAALYTNLKTKITLGAWGSDHLSFLLQNIPSILVVENWETRNPCYHQACDKLDLLNGNYISEITKLNLGVLLQKDL
jgi:hypothetical protein